MLNPKLQNILLSLYWNFFRYKKSANQNLFISKQLDPYTWTSRQNIQEIARSSKPGSRILDVGSGAQWARYFFEKHNHEYLGCDIQESINAEVQNFFVVDENLPISDNYIDVLISNSVLEHLKDPHAALSEYYRVLKPGGVIYVQTNFLYQEHGSPNDFLRFTLEMLQFLITKNGFTVLEKAKIGSRFSLIIDNISAYYTNKMSNVLQYYFGFSFTLRILTFFPFLISTALSAGVGTIIFLILLTLRVLGSLPRFQNHHFYPGVFVKAKKI